MAARRGSRRGAPRSSHAVGIGPDRVVHAGEVDADLPRPSFRSAAAGSSSRKTRAETRAATSVRSTSSPAAASSAAPERTCCHELGAVPPGASTAPIRRQQLQRARHLPSTQVARRRVAPDVRSERRPGAPDLARDLDDRPRPARPTRSRRTPACIRHRLRRAASRKVSKVCSRRRMLLAQEFFPVDPSAHELAIVQLARAESRGTSPAAPRPRCPARSTASSRPSSRCSKAAYRSRRPAPRAALPSIIRCACGLK